MIVNVMLIFDSKEFINMANVVLVYIKYLKRENLILTNILIKLTYC